MLRTYGNLSALQRNMLGWREARRSPLEKDGNAAGSAAEAPDSPHCDQADDAQRMASGSDGSHGRLWLEAQCGGFLVINENLHNLIPCVPLILGAGGLATDFEGNQLIHRKLSQGRCNVLYSANKELHGALMGLIHGAKESLDK